MLFKQLNCPFSLRSAEIFRTTLKNGSFPIIDRLLRTLEAEIFGCETLRAATSCADCDKKKTNLNPHILIFILSERCCTFDESIPEIGGNICLQNDVHFVYKIEVKWLMAKPRNTKVISKKRYIKCDHDFFQIHPKVRNWKGRVFGFNSLYFMTSYFHPRYRFTKKLNYHREICKKISLDVKLRTWNFRPKPPSFYLL